MDWKTKSWHPGVALAALGGGASHRFDLNGDGAVDMGDFAWAAERLSLVIRP